jgi:predicted MPP superfamily phosphohydrolase
VHLPRRAGTAERLNAVLASDFHLGSIIGSSRLRSVVDKINRLEPDVVLFPGDIVDETITAREEVRLSAVMRSLRTRLGVFVSPGNHETFAGLDRTLACFRNCGMTVLQDQAVRVADAFVLVGRRDPSSLKRGEKRLPIGEILAREGIDDSLPVVVLDHQPAHLEEAEKAGVALQLSGHTHAGQVFPLNIINRWVWELNWGRLRKGATEYYVSSGVGTWGPPVRTGSWPEIVRIALIFDRTP